MSSESHQRRMQRFEKEIKEAIASFIVRQMREEIPALVTITRTQVTSDLKSSKVFFSLLQVGDSQISTERAEQVLQTWAPEIQDHLGHSLRLRFVPKLTFQFDQGAEKALKVEKILHDLAKDRGDKGDDGKS